MKIRPFLLVAASLAVMAAMGSAAPEAPPTAPVIASQSFYDLATFGPVATAEQAQAALQKALAAIRTAGGGVLIIPTSAPLGWAPQNTTQEALRKPVPPASAKSWSTGVGVTIIDLRQVRLALPQMTGLTVKRTFDLPENQSAGHWTYQPMLGLSNAYVNGGGDYQATLQEAVKPGNAQKFYVETVNGLYPGLLLEVPQETGKTPLLGEYKETTTVANQVITALGYDKAQKSPYFVADAAVALPAGSVLRARTAVGAIRAATQAHTELQTFDIFNIRHHYSQGDTYMFDGRLHYSGDEYSPDGARPNGIPGARGSVIYNAISKSDTQVFKATVDSFDAGKQELRYTDAKNAQTLGSGRALINLNPKKWITQGSAFILAPGGAILNWGGSLRSKDAPWSQDVVGRFFAVDEPSEIIPRSDNLHRWFYITGFQQEADGTKKLSVRRYWWGAKNDGVGISALRDSSNYTVSPAKPKLLKYIIAPGAEVYDVTGGVALSSEENSGAREHLLKLAPHAFSGTPLDFEKGDTVEQAIGAEPFQPIPFRAWTFDEVPGSFPASIFDVANNGHVQRDSVLSIGRGWFNDIFYGESKIQDFIVVKGDVRDSLIRFEQRNPKQQWLKTFSWNDGAARRELNLNTSTGNITFNGAMNTGGNSLTGLTQLGQSAGKGNLRGIAITVPLGATTFNVTFPQAEPNADYAVTVQPGWLTDHAVTVQSSTGFQVTFKTAAPTGAELNWLLVR